MYIDSIEYAIIQFTMPPDLGTFNPNHMTIQIVEHKYTLPVAIVLTAVFIVGLTAQASPEKNIDQKIEVIERDLKYYEREAEEIRKRKAKWETIVQEALDRRDKDVKRLEYMKYLWTEKDASRKALEMHKELLPNKEVKAPQKPQEEPTERVSIVDKIVPTAKAEETLNIAALSEAVAFAETGGCKTGSALTKNNCHGIMTWERGYRELRHFKTHKDSHEAFMVLWRNKYANSYPDMKLAIRWTGNDSPKTWLNAVDQKYTELTK